MTSDFWPTLAQISATFIGLIFVGIAIFIESIRTAVKEMEAINSVKTVFKEQSTPLSYVLTISNLILFMWPMIIALYMSEVGDNQSIYWLCLLLCVALLITIIILYEWKIKNTVSFLKSEKNIRLFKVRLIFRYILYAIGFLYCLFFTNFLLLFLDISITTNFLKFLSIFSITSGLGLSLCDILIFDVQHTIFKLPDNFPDHIEKASSELHLEKNRIDSIFKEYQERKYEFDIFVNQFRSTQEYLPDILNYMISKLNNDEQKNIQQCHYLQQQINPDRILLFQGIGRETKVMAYKDIIEFIKERKKLESFITDLELLIKQSIMDIQQAKEMMLNYSATVNTSARK